MRNIAAAKMVDVRIQLNRTASIASSFPIEGRATLMEELMKGSMKEDNAATSKTGHLSPPLSISIINIIIDLNTFLFLRGLLFTP